MYNMRFSYNNDVKNITTNNLNDAVDIAIGVSNNMSGLSAVVVYKDVDRDTAEIVVFDKDFNEKEIIIERNCVTQI